MYTFDSRVRYSETDLNGDLKIEALMNYFQDCSTFQSEDLGVGIGYLQENHVAWMVIYWQIDILRLPRLGERIRIGTSPYSIKGIIGLRNFMMETAEGERLVNVNSVWSLIDMEKQLPVRVFPSMVEKYELFPKFDMEYTSRKIVVPETDGRALPPVEVTEEMLDSNRHVNNAQYVRLAQAQLSEHQKITRMRVEYLKQAHLGDGIFPVVYGEETVTVVLNAQDGSPYCIVQMEAGGGTA